MTIQNLPFLWARPTPPPFVGRPLLPVLPGTAFCNHLTMATESVVDATANASMSQSTNSEEGDLFDGGVSVVAAAAPVPPSLAAVGTAQSVAHGDMVKPQDTAAASVSPNKRGSAEEARVAPGNATGTVHHAGAASSTLVATGGQCTE